MYFPIQFSLVGIMYIFSNIIKNLDKKSKVKNILVFIVIVVLVAYLHIIVAHLPIHLKNKETDNKNQ